MVLELTAFKIIQIILAFVMTFAFGMKFKVSDKTRKVASTVWCISLAFILIFNI